LKHPTQNIALLEKEYRNLMQTDKVKAKEIKKKILYFEYGIII